MLLSQMHLPYGVALEALILWKGPDYHLNRKRMRCSRCYSLGGDFRTSHKRAGQKRPEVEEG